QDEDEHVSGIQRVTVVAGRLQEAARLVDRPDTALAFPRRRQPDDSYGIADNDLFFHSAGESGAEGSTSIFAALRRQGFTTAFTNRAAASLGYRPGSVLPLRAASR